MQYDVLELEEGAKEIVFPALVPSEQVTVSYLYFPPMTYGHVNTYVKSDEGMAKVLTVLLQRQFPKWVNWIIGILLLVGIVTVLYLGAKGVLLWLAAGRGA